MYEEPRGARWGPALIAVLVVLAAAAGTGAYLVARQMLDARPDTVAEGSRTTGPGPGSGGNSQTSGTGPGTQTQSGDPGASCPALTTAALKAAGKPGNLNRLLYVDATLAGTSGAEAWICKDSDNTLYYQGHNKTGGMTTADSDSTILLGTGIKGAVVSQGQGYLATNPARDGQTQYIVNREVLTVILPSGEKQTYTVVRYLPS